MRLLIWFFIFSLVFPLPIYAAGNPEKGKQIFKKKCKACHRLTDSKFVGPGLAGVTERRSEEWMHKWLTHPKAMIINGDPIAVELKKKFKKTMPKLKLMQDENNRNDIISFLKEMDKKNQKTQK